MNLAHRLAQLRYRFGEETVLNEQRAAARDSEVLHILPGKLAAALRALRASMNDPRWLRYDTLRGSAEYSEYRSLASLLREFDPATLETEDQKLAFWINLYNGLIMDAVIQWSIAGSVRQVPGFFWLTAYEIGGGRYCAHDIELGILRANRGHPACPRPTFDYSDPRRPYPLHSLDPRIHFTLVCAAHSCPEIDVYDPRRIQTGLSQATQAFLAGGGVEFNDAQGRLALSRLFQWYAADSGAHWMVIGGKGRLLDFIAGYLPAKERRKLGSREWNVRFKAYDWSLNKAWLAHGP